MNEVKAFEEKIMRESAASLQGLLEESEYPLAHVFFLAHHIGMFSTAIGLSRKQSKRFLKDLSRQMQEGRRTGLANPFEEYVATEKADNVVRFKGDDND